jgi:septum formation protein
MTTPPSSIYLASKSPRRQELLRQIGVHFNVIRLREADGRERDIVELPRDGEPASDYVRRIARTKAAIAWHFAHQRGMPPRPMLAADTEVVVDGDILGKPDDAAHAAAMLGRLSGRTHEVLTAVALRWEQEMRIELSTSQVELRMLTASEIDEYIATGEPFDKAGAYAIQGRAAGFIRHLTGSYSGVMGLPLYETTGLLGAIGYHRG